jgi:hypothetical protein
MNFSVLCKPTRPLALVRLFAALATAAFGQGPPSAEKAVPPADQQAGFPFHRLNGQPMRLSALWSNRLAVIMVGSYTCPAFRDRVGAFEALAATFSNQVNFAILYVQEAHPKGDPDPYRGHERVPAQNQREGILLPQPTTFEQRLQHAQLCAEALKLTVTMLIDSMDNAGWRTFGRAPNSAILIGPSGKAVEQELWFDPEKMRSAIKANLKLNLPVTGDAPPKGQQDGSPRQGR